VPIALGKLNWESFMISNLSTAVSALRAQLFATRDAAAAELTPPPDNMIAPVIIALRASTANAPTATLLRVTGFIKNPPYP